MAEKKMKRDAEYHENYTAFVEKFVSKGYASKVPREEIDEPSLWYLPHHGVYHPKKKKIRVVFDCSAKYNGLSLNDVLLQGPDLTNSLIGVLLRFREESVAFIGDIEAMFFQIQVPPDQHDFLRFLWWPNGDLSQPLEEYRMSVHTFGAISSPSIANYALKDTANTADTKYDAIVGHTIRRNFYVDDCLKSCPDVPTAVKLVKELVSATAEGGFRVTSVSKSIRAAVSTNWILTLMMMDY